jgi:hypothetical protein
VPRHAVKTVRDDATQFIRRKVVMMIGLRMWCGARRSMLIAFSVMSWAVIGAAATVEATPFLVLDTQTQTSQDYDYRAKIYKVQNNVETLLSTEAYTYQGATWYEGYGWYYSWKIDQLWYPSGQGSTIRYVVEYRYLGGDWTYFFTTDAPDQNP